MEHNEQQPLDVTLALLGPGQSDVQQGQAHTEKRGQAQVSQQGAGLGDSRRCGPGWVRCA
jgi:hypothetical protein